MKISTETIAASEPRGLARLDAQGLAELRAVVLSELDRKTWLFYEQIKDGVILFTEAQADADRFGFCDAIQAAIVKRTAPATRGKQ